MTITLYFNDADMRRITCITTLASLLLLNACATPKPKTELTINLPEGGYVYPYGKLENETLMNAGGVSSKMVIISTKDLGVAEACSHYGSAYVSWEKVSDWSSSKVKVAYTSGKWASWKRGDTYCIISTMAMGDSTLISHSFICETMYKAYTEKVDNSDSDTEHKTE